MLAFIFRLIDWIAKKVERVLVNWLIRTLSCGPIPKHIAIIMDGNRRYASKLGLADRRLGHYHGYDRFETVLNWCLRLGVKCVTVYAFSVENFKRSPEEVATLMTLAAEKLEKLASRRDIIDRHGVSIRIIGELGMLPEKVRNVAIKAMYATSHHSNYILNICFPFVSRLEMERATKMFNEWKQDPEMSMIEDQVLFRGCLDTFDSPDIDILIRTSGEWRLSEFLLYQLCTSPNCHSFFIDKMWPEFSIIEFGKILLRYQSRVTERSSLSVNLPAKIMQARKKQYADLFATADFELIGR